MINNLSNKLDTLSDTLDLQTKIKEYKEEKEYKLYTRFCNSIEKLINKKFNIAKAELGHRLSMSKEHEKMYYFSFNISIDKDRTDYIHFYIYGDFVREDYTKYKNIKDSLWEITLRERTYISKYYRNFPEKIQLSQLDKIIIRFVKQYFEYKNEE